MRVVKRPPRAAMLIESMRDVGYSLGTALADVVDNAIAAGAINITIRADTSQGRLAVIDDGRGMNEDELLEAMRPGSESPLTERDVSDLGRFGLGLKTASFSQCRSLTVATRKFGVVSIAMWDLDYVAKTGDWNLLVPGNVAEIPWIDDLPTSGTMVLWQKLDRCLAGDEGGVRDFTRKLSEAANHLELVFHRYLAGERPLRRVSITLNGRALTPFDPFFQSHSATIDSPEDVIQYRGKRLKVKAFTLPHRSKVTAEEWDRYAGAAGYLRNQGFYLYRARRLIVHGTWFGLARQMELTKLTRVRIDISNDMDVDWKVDVKKASAHPPLAIRDRLRRIIETLGASSKRVFRGRGSKLTDQNRVPLWVRSKAQGEIRYELSREHPLVRDLEAGLDSSSKAKLQRLLVFASAALPFDALFADMGSEADKVRGSDVSSGLIAEAVSLTYATLTSSGLARELVIDMMRSAEPFRSSWDVTESLLKQYG